VLIPVVLATISSFDQDSFWPVVTIHVATAVSVAYASALLFGVPIFLLFRRLRWLRLWHVISGSVLCGIPFAVFEFQQTRMAHAPIEVSIRWFGSTLVFSLLAGAIFWLVAVRPRNEP
jgi:hypothetical protein